MTGQTLPPGSSAVHDPYNEIVLPEHPDAQSVSFGPRGRYPAWLAYGGPAWLSDSAVLVDLPERIYPVVDIHSDNYGQGLIVRTGGLDFVIDEFDLGYGAQVGWPNGERNAL